jgi:hypothetical protein
MGRNGERVRERRAGGIGRGESGGRKWTGADTEGEGGTRIPHIT